MVTWKAKNHHTLLRYFNTMWNNIIGLEAMDSICPLEIL